jgi:hypothetical protein
VHLVGFYSILSLIMHGTMNVKNSKMLRTKLLEPLLDVSITTASLIPFATRTAQFALGIRKQGTKAAVVHLKHSQNVRSGVALTLQPYLTYSLFNNSSKF